MTNIDGLASGLDSTTIINQLMEIERRPQVALQERRDQEQAGRAELSAIRSDVTAIRNAASDLRLTSGFDQLIATSSNENAVTVQATSAETTGTYSFEVTQVATAASVYSNEVFASLDDATGAAGPSVFNSTGHAPLGFNNVSGTGFADGVIDFQVTQSSAPALVQGAGIPTIPVTVDGTNDSIDIEVDGVQFSITLAHETYDTEQALSDALDTAIRGDSALNAAVRSNLNGDNQIELSTKGEGSDFSVSVTGGTALGALGLTAGATATGTDGIVEVNGTATVITDATSGTAVTLPSGGPGEISATLTGGIREGAATTTQTTSAGSGSLRDLVATTTTPTWTTRQTPSTPGPVSGSS